VVVAFIALGSNLGDRENNLTTAIQKISKFASVTKTSSFYDTVALTQNNDDQPRYLNSVIEIETFLSAKHLLETLHNIETDMGRKRREKWESRIIDLDIIFYGAAIINDKNIIIPHPELHERSFVLEPMNEIAPDFIHPVLNKSISTLLKK
jgi:2-amino-4-hydroxy-6-hydroxymethyldihydropteridine diphosphokinase